MRKKILILLLSIWVVLVCVISILFSKGYGVFAGLYLETGDGVAMLIDNNTPIVMSSNHNGDMFSELSNGDKILVIHDGIAESYPAKTRAYYIMKLNDGEIDDIPQNVVDELDKLGW